jgi:hypothetical protein
MDKDRVKFRHLFKRVLYFWRRTPACKYEFEFFHFSCTMQWLHSEVVQLFGSFGSTNLRQAHQSRTESLALQVYFCTMCPNTSFQFSCAFRVELICYWCMHGYFPWKDLLLHNFVVLSYLKPLINYNTSIFWQLFWTGGSRCFVIWIFKFCECSGDADGRVPVIGSRYCVEALALPIKTQWQPWYLNQQVWNSEL